MEQPLLSNPNTSTTPCSSTNTDSPAAESSPAPPTTLSGLAVVLILASISIWANLEAGKRFDVSILNAAPAGTLAARRFDLLFVSNGRAARILLNASEFVERILYPNELYPRKPVRSVTLHLAGHKLSEVATVVRHGDDPQLPGDFVIHVSPSVMAEADPALSLLSAVQRAMARVWLWDGGGAAPKWLLDAMVEYLSSSAGFAGNAVPVGPGGSCWGEEDPPSVARFFRFCEERRRGFIARLNRDMRKHWNEIMVDGALGSSSQRLCSAYRSRTRQHEEVSGPRSALGAM